MTNVLVITGTGTGVGKTVTTAAIAALASAAGKAVAVVKPAQTSVRAGNPGSDVPDTDTVTRLSGVADTHELARFPDPLSPEAAARVSGLPPLDMAAAADYITKLAAERDLVLVEGAGGLLVRYDPAGTTLADLAAALAAPVLVVAAAGLGTLNHTALTGEALRARGLECAGVVIGSWPAVPGLADRENLADLPVAAGAELAGILPAGAGALGREEFLKVARAGLSASLGGQLIRLLPNSPPSAQHSANDVTRATSLHRMGGSDGRPGSSKAAGPWFPQGFRRGKQQGGQPGRSVSG